MKSGYWTIMWNGRDCGANKMNHHQPQKRPVFIQRWCCVYGGIGRDSSIMSSLLLLFSCQVMSDSLWPHGLQYAKLPCPSPCPGVCPSSCPLHQWCHPTSSSFVTLFSFCLQSFPATRSFPMSQLFASGGQSTGAPAPVLPVSIQGWFPLRLTGLISLLSKGLTRVFSSNTVCKHQCFGTLPSLWSNSHIHTWQLEKTQLWLWTFVSKMMSLLF